MNRILRNQRIDEAVAWAREIIGADGDGDRFAAISLVDEQDQFLAVCVFSTLTETNVDLHIAARQGTSWLSRRYFRAVMQFPFDILGVARISALVRGSNSHAQDFISKIGFAYEGRIRRAFPNGEDLVLYGFLREEYESHPWVDTSRKRVKN